MQTGTFPEFSVHYPLLLTIFMKRPVTLYPDEIGVVYRNPQTARYFRFTWRQWYERTCQLANLLTGPLAVQPGRALDPGDRVATMALNHHRHLELYYAVPCSGAVLHPINVRLSPNHIIHTIRHSEDQIIFVDDLLLPLLERIYDDIKDVVKKFVYISDQPGLPQTKVEPLFEYESLLAQQSKEFQWPVLSEDNYATLCYTTGTTGLPKGCMFTHRQLYLQTLHVAAVPSLANDPATHFLGENAVPMIITPMFHIHAWGAPFHYVFGAQKIILPGMFTVEGFCELVDREKVTNAGVVPTVLAMIVEYPKLDQYDLSSLKTLGVGGGALPLGLKLKAEERIPGFTVSSGYGMTETAPAAIGAFVKKPMRNWPKEKLDEVRVKTGTPVPGLEVQVLDDQGKPIPHDNATVGEIVIRGPWIMMEYFKEPEKTAEVWYDGWFHTGDAAKIDGDDYIIIADRFKDLIRSGSEMVPTVLLENLTSSADFVLEATYVGVPDPIWGERPMALVTPVPGAKETEKDLLKYLETEGVDKGKITKWMLPDYILFTDTIPKTSVGKFDKITIRKNLEEFLSKARKTGEIK
jgi:acyl-CoA synthetase (AMP-forming)/AMP-acid ligase II